METKHTKDDRPFHPVYGRALSGSPFTIDGITFRPYSCGIMEYVRVSDCGRIEIRHHFRSGETFRAAVDGVGLGKKFRSQNNAVKAAIKIMRQSTGAA